MKSLTGLALGLCLLLSACADPLGQPWDTLTHQSLQGRSNDRDRLSDEPTHPDQGTTQTRSIESLDTLSLGAAIHIALHNSPQLREAGYRVDIAAGRATQAGLYPNPSFVFDAEALGSEAGSGGETTYKLEQEILLGDRSRMAKSVAEADQIISQAEFREAQFDVASHVTKAYFAAVSARDRLSSRRELLEFSERFLELVIAKHQAGAATDPDLLRAEILREQAGIDLEAARLEAEASQSSLASAMGLDSAIDIPLTTTTELPHEFSGQESILSRVLETNSRVVIARINIERARRSHQRAKSESVPSLMASIGPRYSDIDNETTLDLGVGIEIPLFDRNQGGIRSAFAERLAAAELLRSVILDLRTETAEAWSAYESSRYTAARYKNELLPKAERTLELTRQAYELGKVDSLRYLDAQQVVIESRIASIDALQRLQEAAATLSALLQDDDWMIPQGGAFQQDEVTR